MNNSISIFIDDIEVCGEITHRSRNDIQVRITNPYYGLETGLHIPLFSFLCFILLVFINKRLSL